MSFIKNIFSRKVKPRKVALVYPTSWETMTRDDFRKVCQILEIKGLGREQGLLLCLCALTNIKPDDPSKYEAKLLKGRQPFIIGGQAHLLGTADIAAACKELSFIYDSIGLPPCPLPEKIIDGKLYGVPFDAYYTADSYIRRFALEPNPSYLREAVKALTQGRLRKFIPWQRRGMVIWWNGLGRYLMQRYPHVLTEGGSVTDRTQAEILRDLLSVLNGNKPQENDAILKSDTHSVLQALENIYANADKAVSR